jgi:hypothetical protein
MFGAGVALNMVVVRGRARGWAQWASAFLGFFLLLVPRVIFEFRHEFLMTRALWTAFTSPDPNKRFISFSLDKIPNVLGQFYDLWNTSLAHRVPLVGILLLIGVVVVLVFHKKLHQEVHWMIQFCLSMLSVFVLGMLFLKDFWGHFVVAVPVLYIVLASVVLYTVYSVKKFGSIFLCLVLIISALINIEPTDLSLSRVASWEGDAAVYRNQVAVVDEVYKEARGKPFKFIAYTPTVHDYTYRYLFSWYGKKTYGYIPEVNKSDVLFVIMEPDFENPQRLVDWLELRQNDGHIQSEKNVKGGIRLQKRTQNI